MTTIADMILAIHAALDEAAFPHAFGGALALAWCTQAPRGTSDIDVNVFISDVEARRVLESLPPGVAWTEADERQVHGDGQTRLWWDTTPVDLFLSTTEFHQAASSRARLRDFAGVMVPFLSCTDLAVFKAFFNRRKDWADLEEMLRAGTVDVPRVVGTLAEYLGPDDRRVRDLLDLAAELRVDGDDRRDEGA